MYIVQTQDNGRKIGGHTDWGHWVIDVHSTGSAAKDRQSSRTFDLVDTDGNKIGHGHIRFEEPGSEKLKWTEAAKRIARGAAGYAKAKLGIDAAGDQIRDARLAICKACPLMTRDKDGGAMRCGSKGDVLTNKKTCGCPLAEKAQISSERCPDGKW